MMLKTCCLAACSGIIPPVFACISEDEAIIKDKEQELFNKSAKSLNATTKLKEEIEFTFKQLKQKGIEVEDLRKISDLTQEYNVNLYDIILDTFKQDPLTKYALIDTLEKIDDLFKQYDNWKEVDQKVF